MIVGPECYPPGLRIEYKTGYKTVPSAQISIFGSRCCEE